MILPDTALLIYAYNEDAPQHQAAREWIEQHFSGSEPLALTWVTLGGFLRVCTSRRIMERPLRISQVIQIIDQWLEQPCIRVIRPGERHWVILKGLLSALDVGGNLVTDAHLAALAIEHDCELHSTDADFARFEGLRWTNPLKH
jgi:uncharacterized protein